MAMATVYNTLNRFVVSGLLREVVVESGICKFDTHVAPHGHLYDVDTGELLDVPLDDLRGLLPVAADVEVVDVEVTVRVRRT